MPQILQIAGGGLETYSRLSEGREAKAAAENNAGIEEDNAGFAIQAGEDRAQQIIRLGDEARATTRARASASGLVADTGSPLLVQEEALYESAKDANKTRYASRVQAFGHRQRARMYRISGKNAEAASYIKGFTSILDTAKGFAGGMGAGGSGGMAGAGSGGTGGGGMSK